VLTAGIAAASDGNARGRVHVLHFVIEQAVRNTVSVMFVAGFIALVAGSAVGWPRFAAWAGTMIGAYGLRALLLQRATRREVIEEHTARWAALLFISTVVGGVIGASAPLLFFPLLPASEQMFLTMILCCWVTGAMTSVGVYPPLYTTYTVIFIGQLILAWGMTDYPHALSISILLFVYGAIMNGFARSFARQVGEGLEIRFQNEALIQQLDAARSAAEAANHAKSRFLAVASHDLRQPLHALTILSGLLGRHAASETTAEVAQQITRSVGSLEKLFSSLLDLSRLEVGAMLPELRSTALEPIIDELGAEFRPRAQAKGLAFEARSCEVAIVTDRTLLERILRNLIDNAIKYTERGSVELTCERVAGAVVIRVRDTGPGIAPEDREAIFEEFYQGGSQRQHREGGLGLGLAIVKRLSDLLGYTIETESALGAGTRFELVIPATLIGADPGDARSQGQENPQVSLEGFAIVYVDDDTRVHAAMSLLLREWGCNAVVAATLEEARAGVRERGMRPEAILTDYSLAASVTGFDVIEALRDEYGPLPAAIITGETAPGSREKLSSSEYPVLLKPAQPAELRKLLEVFRSVG
jgi:signal transduction histidine kinase